MIKNKIDRNFYKMLFSLMIPMALQNLINVGVTAADVFMLGKVSDEVLSGASLGGQIQFVMTLIFFGLTSGASVLIAQYWGKKDVLSIEKILAISVKFCLVVSVIFTIVTYIFPESLMRLFTSSDLVVTEGAKYLRIVCFSYIILGLTMVYLNTLRSIEHVILATIIYTISLFINVIGNAIFIFGLFGCPQFGIKGAAISTLIARITEFLIIIYYDRRRNKIFKFKFSSLFEKNKELREDFIKYSAPVIMNELLWGLGTAIIAGIIGKMGSAASAASSITQVVRQLAQVLSFGVATSAAVIIGKSIGEGNIDKAKKYSVKLAKMSIATGILGSIVILITRVILLKVYSLTPEAMGYLSSMMFVMAYFVIAQSYNTTLVVGIFRAGGDTKYGLILDVTFMWTVSIVCGFVASFVLKCSVPIVFIILMSDEIIKIPFSTKRFLSFKWLNNVTR